jgi:cytochrome P450
MSTGVENPSSGSDTRAQTLVRSLFDGTVADPYPIYEELREKGDGIHWAEDVHGYIVCRYEDVRTIGADAALYSSDMFWDTPQSWHDPENPTQKRFVDITSRSFLFSDPPYHTKVRSSFRKAFTPQAMRRWRPLVEEVTTRLIDDYRPGDEIDIMPGLAADVPVAVIAAILGVPEERQAKFREWSIAYASTFDPMAQGERRDTIIAISMELVDYLAELAAERRADPADDLISLLIATETSDGGHLSDDELLATLTLLLAAGNETTTNVIGSGLSLLLEHPQAKAELAADLTLMPEAVEEMIRYEPPLHLLFRKTTGEAHLGDHAFGPGTTLLPCPPAANRDPRRFEDPLAFDIRRTDNRHVSVFHGIHFCVGAALARLETAVVFEQILKGYPGITYGTEPGVRRSSNSTVRGWQSRPVRL